MPWAGAHSYKSSPDETMGHGRSLMPSWCRCPEGLCQGPTLMRPQESRPMQKEPGQQGSLKREEGRFSRAASRPGTK